MVALGAGIDFINKIGIERIYAHEQELCDLFVTGVASIPGVELIAYNLSIAEHTGTLSRVPLVSFNISGLNSTETAEKLSNAGFALRGGLHCAYLTHRKLGTLENGVVRFAPSIFNTKREILAFVKVIEHIRQSSL